MAGQKLVIHCFANLFSLFILLQLNVAAAQSIQNARVGRSVSKQRTLSNIDNTFQQHIHVTHSN